MNDLNHAFEKKVSRFEPITGIACDIFVHATRCIAILKPRKNTVWFLVDGSSPGGLRGPKSANPPLVSHWQAYEPPADPIGVTFKFKEILRSWDWFAAAPTIQEEDLSTPVTRYNSPFSIVDPRPFKNAYHRWAFFSACCLNMSRKRKLFRDAPSGIKSSAAWFELPDISTTSPAPSGDNLNKMRD
jgi:hypothetical protein